MLLNIDAIQPPLSYWLLENLTLVALEFEDKIGNSIEKNVPKLMLNHLRWLNSVKNGEALADKLIEILDATPESVTIGKVDEKTHN